MTYKGFDNKKEYENSVILSLAIQKNLENVHTFFKTGKGNIEYFEEIHNILKNRV